MTEETHDPLEYALWCLSCDADELRSLSRHRPLSLADREDVREIIRTLNQIVGAEQMEAA